MGLDQTSEEACRILKELGEDAVEKIYQKCVEYGLIVKKNDEKNGEKSDEQSNEQSDEKNEEKNNEEKNCNMLQDIFSQLEDLPKKEETAQS